MIRMTIPLRFRTVAAAASAALAITLCLAPDASAQRRRRGSEPKLEHFTSFADSFRSEAIGGRAEYRIYLPVGYEDESNADTEYPLILWLHGMWEDHNRFHGRGGAKVLDAMRGADEIPEAIVVCCNATKASFYINGAAKNSNYEDLVSVDLVAHVAESYRISKDTRKRAICGVSMGGYGALKIALRHPERFGIVAAHSAAILPENPDDLEKEFPWLKRWGGATQALRSIFGKKEVDLDKWREESLPYLAKAISPEDAAPLKIYFDCGDADDYGFFPPNRKLHEALEGRKIRHSWRVGKGGGHGWRSGYNTDAMPHSLKFVAAALRASDAVSGLGGLMREPASKPSGTDSSDGK